MYQNYVLFHMLTNCAGAFFYLHTIFCLRLEVLLRIQLDFVMLLVKLPAKEWIHEYE